MGARNLRTQAQLVKEGYIPVIPSKPCGYAPCTAMIEIWRTPKGRLMPFDRIVNPDIEGVPLFEPHFASCKGLEARDAQRKAGGDQEPEPGGKDAAAGK